MANKTKIILVLTCLMMVTVYQIGKLQPYITLAETTTTLNDTAIRIRIIPNSNKYEDQQAKKMVKYSMDEYLNSNQDSFKTIDSTREFITGDLSNIQSNIEHVLSVINYDQNFTVSYGAHLFPEKQFKGQIYEEGYYESLVITLGEGLGNNWWCFMNPDLCLGPSLTKLPSSDDSWNAQYTAMENTQEAFQQQNFKSYFAEVVETLFGGRNEESTQNSYVSAEQNTNNNWYLYEDEY